MKLRLGPVPENTRFHPEVRGWRPLPRDKPGRFMALAIPVTLLLFAAFVAVAELADLGGLGAGPPPVAAFVLLILASVVVHEFLHVVAHPGWTRSKRTVVGLWPRCGVFYAHYDGRRGRNRLLVGLLLPFVLLAVVPLLVCAAVGCTREWIVMLVALNAAFAGGDIVATLAVLKHIPRGAAVRNKGWRTWWKADPETMARCPLPAPGEKPKGLRRLVGPAKWVGAVALFLLAVILVFEPFFGGHGRAKSDFSAPTRVFEPGHGYHPVGTAGEGGVVRLWKGAPDWVESCPGPSRAIWRAGYRFQMWKRGMTVVLVDERPKMVGHPDFLKNRYDDAEEEGLDEDIADPDEPEPDEQ